MMQLIPRNNVTNIYIKKICNLNTPILSLNKRLRGHVRLLPPNIHGRQPFETKQRSYYII
jgi:hypothetical protein